MRMTHKGATYDNIDFLSWEVDMLITNRDSIYSYIITEILPIMFAGTQIKVDFGNEYKAIGSKPTTDFHLIVNAEPRIYTSGYPGIVPDKAIRIGVSKRYAWSPMPLLAVRDPKPLYALTDDWVRIKRELETQLARQRMRRKVNDDNKILVG